MEGLGWPWTCSGRIIQQAAAFVRGERDAVPFSTAFCELEQDRSKKFIDGL